MRKVHADLCAEFRGEPARIQMDLLLLVKQLGSSWRSPGWCGWARSRRRLDDSRALSWRKDFRLAYCDLGRCFGALRVRRPARKGERGDKGAVSANGSRPSKAPLVRGFAPSSTGVPTNQAMSSQINRGDVAVPTSEARRRSGKKCAPSRRRVDGATAVKQRILGRPSRPPELVNFNLVRSAIQRWNARQKFLEQIESGAQRTIGVGDWHAIRRRVGGVAEHLLNQHTTSRCGQFLDATKMGENWRRPRRAHGRFSCDVIFDVHGRYLSFMSGGTLASGCVKRKSHKLAEAS